MPVQTNSLPPEPISQQEPSARDRLLAALASAPRLSDEDAERINKAIQEAREASIADSIEAAASLGALVPVDRRPSRGLRPKSL